MLVKYGNHTSLHFSVRVDHWGGFVFRIFYRTNLTTLYTVDYIDVRLTYAHNRQNLHNLCIIIIIFVIEIMIKMPHLCLSMMLLRVISQKYSNLMGSIHGVLSSGHRHGVYMCISATLIHTVTGSPKVIWWPELKPRLPSIRRDYIWSCYPHFTTPFVDEIIVVQIINGLNCLRLIDSNRFLSYDYIELMREKKFIMLLLGYSAQMV